jgi:hypothetical protein
VETTGVVEVLNGDPIEHNIQQEGVKRKHVGNLRVTRLLSGGTICPRSCHEHRPEGERGMKAYVALMITALVLGAMVSSCATGWPPPPTAPECIFIERCRNPALSSPGGN